MLFFCMYHIYFIAWSPAEAFCTFFKKDYLNLSVANIDVQQSTSGGLQWECRTAAVHLTSTLFFYPVVQEHGSLLVPQILNVFCHCVWPRDTELISERASLPSVHQDWQLQPEKGILYSEMNELGIQNFIIIAYFGRRNRRDPARFPPAETPGLELKAFLSSWPWHTAEILARLSSHCPKE